MTYPTTPKFSSMRVRSNDPTYFSQSLNGRTQSRKIAAQVWEFSASYPPLTRAEFQPVSAYIDSLRGRHTVFTVTPTEISSTTGTATVSTVTCTAAAIGDSTVATTGLSGTLKAGDFIKFSGHDKVYRLTADLSGNGNLSIVPPLIAAVTTDTVTYNDVPFTVRLNNDVQEHAIGVDMLHKFEVDFIEVIS
jgi:hypothetical protein